MLAWWNLFKAAFEVVAFGGIDGVLESPNGKKMSERQNSGGEVWWRLIKIEDFGEISK